MNKPVTICMSVYRAEGWLPAVLASLRQQTYPPELIQLLTWDNNQGENIGFWAGFERLLPAATGTYVIALTDVVLDPHFIERAVNAMEADDRIGALQAKLLQPDGTTIDSTGFSVSRSRRITNRGQGETDHGQYERAEEIFAVEGAVPVFRRAALDACLIDGWLIDPDYRRGPLGYGDDLDLAWRMRLFGWKQWYAPDVIGYHGRSTTTGIARTPIVGQLARLGARRAIVLQKRRLDWSNVRFTLIKNEHIINVLRHLPSIVAREIAVQGYTVLFEPAVLREWGRFIRLLPRMVARRRTIMRRAIATPASVHRFIT